MTTKKSHKKTPTILLLILVNWIPALALAGNPNFSRAANVETFQFGTDGAGEEAITTLVARPDGRLVLTGTLGATVSMPTAGATHHLVDRNAGKSYAFVAELSADGQTCNWFSLFGADLLTPNAIALAPDGSIALGGQIGSRMKSVADAEVGSFRDRTAVIIKITADGSAVEWIRAGLPNQKLVESMVVDAEGRILHGGGTRGRGNAAYIGRINADGSASTFPAQPEGREWNIDFDVRKELFLQDGQVGTFYELAKGSPDGYDYDGEGGWGPTQFKMHGIRQGIHIVVLPNGDIAASGTLQYDFKVKGKKKYPAFDTIVARWSADGELLWSTNLYQEGDGVHTPDQKDRDLIYNPVNGDLYVLVAQHGSNIYRLTGTLVGDTGNLFISWIGRVDAKNGKLKEGWYWQNSRNTGYDKNGLPKSPPHPDLSGNDAAALGVDSQGNIYFAGNAGARAFTTRNAWKPWPADASGGQNAALTVLSPDLDRILYATMITGEEHGEIKAYGMAVTPSGVWVAGRNGTSGLPGSSAGWSADAVQGENDAFIARFQFD